MITREVPLPSSLSSSATTRPVTANSQLWSLVLTVNRIVSRLKRNTKKYAGQEGERMHGDVKGLNAWKSVVSLELRIRASGGCCDSSDMH
jgi:hypothetical protein